MKARFALLLALSAAWASPAAAETIRMSPFGDVSVYRPAGEIKSVAILLSDETGWDKAETGIAAELTGADTLVLGVDSAVLLKNEGSGGKACFYPAGSLQDLARMAQKNLNLPAYIEPMLVGHGGGSALAYAAIAEAPDNTFKGGIGLGFCPRVKTTRPLCKGADLTESVSPGGGYTVGAVSSLGAAFTVLQGTADQACPAGETHDFFASTNGATVVDLPGVGGAFTTPGDYSDNLTDEYWRIAGTDSSFKLAQAALSDDLQGLPLTEVRDSTVPESDTFAIFLSGDGGWADLDSSVSAELAKRGVPVVGVSSLKYFWDAQTPETVATDMGRVAEYYMRSWQKKRFILVGYSFGADVVPFAANRLEPGIKARLAGVGVLSPSHNADFEFHVSGWLGEDTAGPPTMPEFAKLSSLPVVCVYGAAEDDSACPDLSTSNVKQFKTSGGHHLGSEFEAVAAAIVKAAARS